MKANLETYNCSVCKRDFMTDVNGCPAHCTHACCRSAQCKNAQPTQASVRSLHQVQKRCKVCHTPGRYFERFTPCDENCYRMHYRGKDIHHKTICITHKPVGNPRLHVEYCSLRCYNSWTLGHQERAAQKRRQHYFRHHDALRGAAAYRKEGHLQTKQLSPTDSG